MKTYSYLEMAMMNKFELNEFLISEYNYLVPNRIEYADDLKEAGHLLMLITNANSFLTSILSTVSLMKRKYKREYEKYKKGSEDYINNKREFEDYVDKELVLANKINSLDDIKQTVSRMITIKQEIDKELHMSGDNS